MDTDTVNEDCTPSWLVKEVVVEALLSDDPDKDVSNVKIAPVKKVEGGNLSETFRVFAQSDGGNSSWETSLIVKAPPNLQGDILAVVLESGVHDREATAYSHFLPSVSSALRKVEGESWTPLAPKLYLHGTQPTFYLILEDLVASGFRKVDYSVNLELDQCVAVVRNIARMHATSILLLDDERYATEKFRTSLMFSDKSLLNLGVLRKYHKVIVNILDKYSQFKPYTEKLYKNLDEIFVQSVRLVVDCRDHFKVMLHGDLHKKNMMFRSREEQVQACFYDFQGLHIGSPAEDLHYFLHSSARVEVLRDCMDLLLSEYHGTLQRTMRALGLEQQADAYPLDQLRRDMEHFGLVAVFASLHMLPVTLCTNTAGMPTDSTADDFEEKLATFLEKTCNNEQYLQYMEHLIPLFDGKGLLEPKSV